MVQNESDKTIRKEEASLVERTEKIMEGECRKLHEDHRVNTES